MRSTRACAACRSSSSSRKTSACAAPASRSERSRKTALTLLALCMSRTSGRAIDCPVICYHPVVQNQPTGSFMKRLLLVIAVALAFAVPMHAADSSDALVSTLVTQAPGLRADVLKLALTAPTRAADEGLVRRRDVLTVIDYS